MQGVIAALSAEAGDRGARATMAVCPPRSIDNEEPPRAVAEAMRASDVVFLPVTHALAHTRATREAIGAGARVLSMTAFTPGQMERGGLMADFRARKPLCDALAARLSEAREVRVTNPAGTELTFSLEGRAGNSHACVLDGTGFTAVPNIEANTSPLDGTTSGTLVVDGSMLSGILTERDVLRAAGKPTDMAAEPISRWMSPEPITCSPDIDTEEAAEMMLSGGFRHLPVVDATGLLGIVSLRDVLSARIGRSG